MAFDFYHYPHTDLNQSNFDWIIQTLKDVQNKVDNFGGIVVVQFASDMTDHEAIYVYIGNEAGMTTNGWYYYDTSLLQWTLGGTWGGFPVTYPITVDKGGSGKISAPNALRVFMGRDTVVANLDTLTNTGFMLIDIGSTNLPGSYINGYVLFLSPASQTTSRNGVQIFFSLDGSEIYFRVFWSNAWTAWTQIL